jgi:cellulose synthase/poly-beta-1,6-N-acetylglucosamine synthase-like glycosyltransferase
VVTLLEITGVLIIVYFLLLNGTYAVFTLVAWRSLVNHRRSEPSLTTEEVFRSPLTPPVSVLLPAFNEEAGVVESVRSLLLLRYPEMEIVVIDDGSTDSTVARLEEAFDLHVVRKAFPPGLATKPVKEIRMSRRHPGLMVVSKENGGKADALNCGLNFSRYPYVCAVDGDALLETEALLRVMTPIIDDPRVVAAGGIVRIANGCEVASGKVVNVRLPRRPLPTLQVVEYLRAFLVGRVGWSALGALLIISGAFGVFKRSVVIDVGGYETDTVGEDMELVVRMHRRLRSRHRDYRIAFVPDPVSWTEAPESLSILGRQRKRWQRGLADTLWRHRGIMIDRNQGVLAWFAVPYYFVFEFLGPLVELFGYVVIPIAWSLGVLSTDYMLAFLLVALVWGILLSVAAVALEELTFRRYPLRREVLRLTLYGVLDNFGYRQLTNLWRIQGLIQFARGQKDWGAMPRKGFGQNSEAGQAASEAKA